MQKEIIAIHIKYSNIEVKELSELLYIINTSINSYYRENGISNSQVQLFAPTIQRVKEGSIILEVLIEKILSYSIDAIAHHIKKRLDIIKEKKVQKKYSKQIFKYDNIEKIEINIEDGKITITCIK